MLANAEVNIKLEVHYIYACFHYYLFVVFTAQAKLSRADTQEKSLQAMLMEKVRTHTVEVKKKLPYRCRSTAVARHAVGEKDGTPYRFIM